MKYLITKLIFILFISMSVFGQTKNKIIDNKTAIKNLKIVFDDYVKYQESTDSRENKEFMIKNLESINKVTDLKELEVLINIWMYYDPTDFSGGSLVYKILMNSRPESLKAVKFRMINKKEWETEETAPFSELNDLLKNLKTDNKKSTLELIQGQWIYDKDSLASIQIDNYQWSFNYEGNKIYSEDNYEITITNRLPEFVNDDDKSEFIVLKTKTDTLRYEILGITDTTLSLMFYPTGRIHIYRRQNKK